MKKNMLAIIIAALAAINVILSAVLIFVVVPTLSKTNQIVTKVADIIDLELESPDEKQATQISVEDIKTYPIEGELTINLKKPEGATKDNYVMLTVTLSMDTTSPDFKKLEAKVPEQVNTIKEIVTNTFGQFSADEAKSNTEQIKQEILSKIEELFGSSFIINVSFGNPRYQQ